MGVVSSLGTGLAANRSLFGIGYLVAPERSGSGWIGKAAEDDRTAFVTRALGARDLVLGLGALWAQRGGGTDPRGWFAAHAVADGVDLLATLAAREKLPARNFAFAATMAGASTAIALATSIAEHD
jgi:hypothetical protein